MFAFALQVTAQASRWSALLLICWQKIGTHLYSLRKKSRDSLNLRQTQSESSFNLNILKKVSLEDQVLCYWEYLICLFQDSIEYVEFLSITFNFVCMIIAFYI